MPLHPNISSLYIRLISYGCKFNVWLCWDGNFCSAPAPMHLHKEGAQCCVSCQGWWRAYMYLTTTHDNWVQVSYDLSIPFDLGELEWNIMLRRLQSLYFFCCLSFFFSSGRLRCLLEQTTRRLMWTLEAAHFKPSSGLLKYFVACTPLQDLPSPRDLGQSLFKSVIITDWPISNVKYQCFV